MSPATTFEPEHMNAQAEDFVGNAGRGRVVFLPGSDGRAAQIAEHFAAVSIKRHPRGHNLYVGTLPGAAGAIDVACISTGMGGASLDIIGNELFSLGARRFLRVGTAGSLQTGRIRSGAVVVPTAAVRDEGTSRRYLPLEVPVTPSVDVLVAAHAVAQARVSGGGSPVFLGVIHSKDSLHAREFGAGPMALENRRFMDLLRAGNVLASEMECAQLFTLRAVWEKLCLDANQPLPQVGAVLAIIGDDQPFADKTVQSAAIRDAIDFAIALVLALEPRGVPRAAGVPS